MKADSSPNSDNLPAAPDQPASTSSLLSHDLTPEPEKGLLPRRPDDSEIVEGAVLLIPVPPYAVEQAGIPGPEYAAIPDIDEPFDFPSDTREEYAAMPDIDEPFDFPSDVRDELNGR